MTIDIRPGRRAARSMPRFAEPETLKQLPARRPATSASPSSRIQWSLIDTERYEVTASGSTIGFIDVAGAVFVALAGPRYDRAVEATQTLVFEDAIDALTRLN